MAECFLERADGEILSETVLIYFALTWVEIAFWGKPSKALA
jgi:hypothetical protein